MHLLHDFLPVFIRAFRPNYYLSALHLDRILCGFEHHFEGSMIDPPARVSSV